MLSQGRSLLSKSRARAFFPVTARLDVLDARIAELTSRLDQLVDQQRKLTRLLDDISVEVTHQQGRLGALEELANSSQATQAIDDRNRERIERSLS